MLTDFKMRLLILGKGYIGTHLFKSSQQYDLVDPVFHYPRKSLDYANQKILESFLSDHKIDIVVNASGFTGRPNVDQCEQQKNECWFNNVVVPSVIESSCKTTGCRFIQISSGCIYTGYEKKWTEHDIPNFGLYDESSSYSKTKHASELVLDKDYTTILRIRMPFSECNSDRNFINKLFKYDKLISYDNSMTCVEDFCNVLLSNIDTIQPGIYNMVHDESLSAKQITNAAKQYVDREFEFVSIDQLSLAAPRSNCVMSTQKIQNLGLSLPPVNDSLDRCLRQIFKHA